MTIDLNRLKSMKKEELLELAKQVNAPHHHKNAPETLIENIINKVMEQMVKPENTAPKEEKKAKELVFVTEEELEEVVAPIKERNRAFTTVYDHEARCVTMRYNDGRYKHAETMSLSCTIARLKRKALEISKGPLVVRTLKQEEWAHLGGNTAKNQYTESVLAG